MGYPGPRPARARAEGDTRTYSLRLAGFPFEKIGTSIFADPQNHRLCPLSWATQYEVIALPHIAISESERSMTLQGLPKADHHRFAHSRLNRARLLPLAALCSLGLTTTLPAQVAGGFAPGGRELAAIDFTQAPLGELPTNLRQLRGSMTVVEKDGKRMLRATDNAEFLVSLPESLPEHFTLEFDLITRVDYNTEELGFEGTPAFNRGAGSANILWYRTDISVLGGREAGPAYIKMPADLAAEVAGQPAEVRVDFNGTRLRLYTNGRQLVDLPDVKFVRGRVLRVFLGGHDSGLNAVHLSRLRIADASTSAPAVAQQQSALTGGTTAPAITGITANVNSLGAAWVTWNPLPVAATYVVLRWKADDPACCNAMSPPGQPLTGTGWQDGVLTTPGTYAYRVIATTATGVISGEVSFVYRGSGTTVGGAVASGTGTTGTATAVAPTSATVLAPAVPLLTSPTTTATATPVTQPSTPPAPAPSSPPAPAPAPKPATGRYSIVLAGLMVTRESLDDALERDGKRNEVYGAAAVVAWDRSLNRLREFRFEKTREYGDVNQFPDRIKAGNASMQGGLSSGDRVPEGFDPAGAALPAATGSQFPLLLWEGDLTAGVEAIAVFPSVWERDTDASKFEKYRANWSNNSPSVLMNSETMTRQSSNAAVTASTFPLDPASAVGTGAGDMFVGALLGSIGMPAEMLALPAVLGISFDRPFGVIQDGALGFMYQERVVLITQEKLSSVPVGGGVTVPIQYTEPLSLGGALTLYLRIQRIR